MTEHGETVVDHAKDHEWTGDDFALFLGRLISESEDQTYWANVEVENYLLACASWAGDMAGFFQREHAMTPSMVPWQYLAEMLSSATVYE